MPDEEWAEFGQEAAAMGTDRAKLIVAFIKWWIGVPGAELPERPKGGRR